MPKRTPTRVLLVFALINFLCLYFWTSAFLMPAVYIFFAFLVLVGVACYQSRNGKMKPLFLVTLLSLMATTTIASVEAVLWIHPHLLRGELADWAYGRYHHYTGGMYQPDQHCGYRLKPNTTYNAYWAGYWWKHQTNSKGFRGPEIEQADVVFLGDSMIYGHGVDDDQTAAARFEERTGITSANLGQQATSALQALRIFETTGIALKPKVVFFCAHMNDIPEAEIWYPRSELEHFLASPVDSTMFPEAYKRLHPTSVLRLDRSWREQVELSLRTRGLLTWISKNGLKAATSLLGPNATVRHTYTTGSPIPLGHQYRVTASDELGWRVHVKSLQRLKHRCHEIGAELIIFDIGMPHAFVSDMRALTQELGVRYSDAGSKALSLALSGEQIYLKDDGHWTPLGNDKIAEALITEFAPEVKLLASDLTTKQR